MQVIMHTKCSLKQRDIRSLCVGVTHMCVLNLLDRLSGCKQHCIWHVLWRVVFVRVKGYSTTSLAFPLRILTMQSNRSGAGRPLRDVSQALFIRLLQSSNYMICDHFPE